MSLVWLAFWCGLSMGWASVLAFLFILVAWAKHR